MYVGAGCTLPPVDAYHWLSCPSPIWDARMVPGARGGAGRGDATADSCSCQRELGLPLRAAALAPAAADARRVARTVSTLIAIPAVFPCPSRARRRCQSTYLPEGTSVVAAYGPAPSHAGRVHLATSLSVPLRTQSSLYSLRERRAAGRATHDQRRPTCGGPLTVSSMTTARRQCGCTC